MSQLSYLFRLFGIPALFLEFLMIILIRFGSRLGKGSHSFFEGRHGGGGGGGESVAFITIQHTENLAHERKQLCLDWASAVFCDE